MGKVLSPLLWYFTITNPNIPGMEGLDIARVMRSQTSILGCRRLSQTSMLTKILCVQLSTLIQFWFFFTLTSMSIITLMRLHFRYRNPHCIYHILSFLLFLDSSFIFLTVLCSFGENVIITFTKSIIGRFKFFLFRTRSFTCFTRPITFVFDQYWSPSLCHIIDQLDVYIHYH